MDSRSGGWLRLLARVRLRCEAGVCGAVVERGASSENEYQQGLDVVQWDRGAEGGCSRSTAGSCGVSVERKTQQRSRARRDLEL